MYAFTFPYPQHTWCPNGRDEVVFYAEPSEYFLSRVREAMGDSAMVVDNVGTTIRVFLWPRPDSKERFDDYVKNGIECFSMKHKVTPLDVSAIQKEGHADFPLPYQLARSTTEPCPPPPALERPTSSDQCETEAVGPVVDMAEWEEWIEWANKTMYATA